jgi:hypothetical protein
MKVNTLAAMNELARTVSERGSLFGPGYPLAGREEGATGYPLAGVPVIIKRRGL